MKSKNLTTLLGLAFENGHLTALMLRRRNGRRAVVRQVFRTALSLDPMSNDPVLVGREIRNHLTSAGIRENRCLVCVPMQWALSLHAELPELSEEDEKSFLDVRAEREFPFGPEDLSISVSKYGTPGGRREATMAAIPRHHLNALTAALKAARIKPIGIAVGATSLLPPDTSRRKCSITLAVGMVGVDLVVSCGRGIVAMRSLEDVLDTGGDQPAVDVEQVARQIRITLGQLAPDVREALRTLRVFAPGDAADSIAEKLEPAVSRLGLTAAAAEMNFDLITQEPGILAKVSPGITSVVANRLLGRPKVFEFLPPAVSRFRQLTSRASTRGTRWLAATASGIVLICGGALLYQHFRLSSLEARWRKIEPKVTEVSELQTKIRTFRSWYAESPRHLQIAKTLTSAFPEEGSVWAKSMEIREVPDSSMPLVTCSGKARSNSAWLTMLENLRNTKGVEDLAFNNVQGQNPVQFTVSFRWNEGAADGV